MVNLVDRSDDKKSFSQWFCDLFFPGPTKESVILEHEDDYDPNYDYAVEDLDNQSVYVRDDSSENVISWTEVPDEVKSQVVRVIKNTMDSGAEDNVTHKIGDIIVRLPKIGNFAQYTFTTAFVAILQNLVSQGLLDKKSYQPCDIPPGSPDAKPMTNQDIKDLDNIFDKAEDKFNKDAIEAQNGGSGSSAGMPLPQGGGGADPVKTVKKIDSLHDLHIERRYQYSHSFILWPAINSIVRQQVENFVMTQATVDKPFVVNHLKCDYVFNIDDLSRIRRRLMDLKRVPKDGSVIVEFSSASDKRTENNAKSLENYKGPDDVSMRYVTLTDEKKQQMADIKMQAQLLINKLRECGSSADITLAIRNAQLAAMWGTKHVTSKENAENSNNKFESYYSPADSVLVARVSNRLNRNKENRRVTNDKIVRDVEIIMRRLSQGSGLEAGDRIALHKFITAFSYGRTDEELVTAGLEAIEKAKTLKDAETMIFQAQDICNDFNRTRKTATFHLQPTRRVMLEEFINWVENHTKTA